jgi:hypothetical protein
MLMVFLFGVDNVDGNGFGCDTDYIINFSANF